MVPRGRVPRGRARSGASVGAAAARTAGSCVRRDSGAHGRHGAIQVLVVCIGPAEQTRTMKFMLYFSLHKRKP